MKKYLLYLLSALALVSCAREWLPDETPLEDLLIERTFTVVMDDATRAFLNEDLSPVWEVGEELSVYTRCRRSISLSAPCSASAPNPSSTTAITTGATDTALP